jgi:hypothetical protein
MILGQETPQECQNDSLKSYHHAKKSCTSHEMKRYDRGVSPQGNGNCKAGVSYEFMHRAHRASTEGRKMGGSVGVWGTPCSIQRGLARRLCILLVCTDPLSARVCTKTSRGISPLWGGSTYRINEIWRAGDTFFPDYRQFSAPLSLLSLVGLGLYFVFRLKWTKFRFVFRSKKAQISLLISFCINKFRAFRIA